MIQKLTATALTTLALLAPAMMAHAQPPGDQPLIEKGAEAAAAVAAEKARQGLGISPGVATGVGVFLTPSTTASSAQSECLGTTNCSQGFPSTPAPLPPAPPAPVGYLQHTQPAPTESQLTVPQE